MGKTRLALRIATKVRSAFRDGAWLVELAALEDPDLLVQAVATPLGIRDWSSRPTRDVLLVLDNCEHLIDACADFVRALLGVAPQVRVLATGRRSLRIEGERLLFVPPLSLPDSARMPQPDELDVVDLVENLVDKSILTRTDPPHSQCARYHMLDTIRRYGQEKLRAAGEERRGGSGTALWVYSWAASHQGEPVASGASAEQSRRLAEQLGDKQMAAYSLQVAGLSALSSGDLEGTRALCTEAWRRHCALGHVGSPAVMALMQQGFAGLCWQPKPAARRTSLAINGRWRQTDTLAVHQRFTNFRRGYPPVWPLTW